MTTNDLNRQIPTGTNETERENTCLFFGIDSYSFSSSEIFSVSPLSQKHSTALANSANFMLLLVLPRIQCGLQEGLFY